VTRRSKSQKNGAHGRTRTCDLLLPKSGFTAVHSGSQIADLLAMATF
jgi:hypothetical protein